MSLSAFIANHREAIISDFAAFAETLMPTGVDMTQVELRDHAEEMLKALIQDMAAAQSPEEE